MSALVFELQADAINEKVSCSDLLRKALAVSTKLAVEDIEKWIRQELNGYPRSSVDEVPDYRVIHGQVKVLTPYQHLQPFNYGDAEITEILSRREIKQPIAELVALLEDKKTGSLIHLPLPPNIAESLRIKVSTGFSLILIVPDTEIVGILNAVRNRILEWALELEKRGVVGKGKTFSTEERRIADQVTYQTINNIGSMQNSQFLQNSPGASQNFQMNTDLNQVLGFIEQINTKKSQLGLDEESASELDAKISTIQSSLQKTKPNPKIMTEALKSIRSILERVTGNVAANVLLVQIAKLLQ